MRRRISWLVLATTSAIVVSLVVPLCLLVRTVAEERAMDAADQEARSVAILVARLHNAPEFEELLADIDQRGAPTTDVLLEHGRRLGSDPGLADDPDVQRAKAGEGFSETDDDGGRVLLPVVTPDGTAVVRTTVTSDQLHDGVAAAWAGIIALGLVLLALAYVVAARLGRRISEPLMEVAGTAHRLREGDLSARATVGGGPEETEELARALNGLAERTGELLATERAAVGDLSHRLRTPVTALRLDAEAVEDEELATKLQQHIAVLQRTIDAIVREARRPVRSDLAPGCDATAVLRGRVEFWRPLAEDQGRSLEVVLPSGPAKVSLAEDDLADLVDVLVDNVFAHTDEGVGLKVDLRRSAGQVVLTVSDAGPGFPAGGSTPRPGSTGLGLDIVGRTARDAGGELRLGRSAEGGAVVELTLPLLED
jgi:signal transduction histidine kinase